MADAPFPLFLEFLFLLAFCDFLYFRSVCSLHIGAKKRKRDFQDTQSKSSKKKNRSAQCPKSLLSMQTVHRLGVCGGRVTYIPGFCAAHLQPGLARRRSDTKEPPRMGKGPALWIQIYYFLMICIHFQWHFCFFNIVIYHQGDSFCAEYFVQRLPPPPPPGSVQVGGSSGFLPSLGLISSPCAGSVNRDSTLMPLVPGWVDRWVTNHTCRRLVLLTCSIFPLSSLNILISALEKPDWEMSKERGWQIFNRRIRGEGRRIF